MLIKELPPSSDLLALPRAQSPVDNQPTWDWQKPTSLLMWNLIYYSMQKAPTSA